MWWLLHAVVLKQNLWKGLEIIQFSANQTNGVWSILIKVLIVSSKSLVPVQRRCECAIKLWCGPKKANAGLLSSKPRCTLTEVRMQSKNNINIIIKKKSQLIKFCDILKYLSQDFISFFFLQLTQ